MFFTNFIQSVCLLLFSPCIISTYNHDNGRNSSSFDAMNATDEFTTKHNAVISKDGKEKTGNSTAFNFLSFSTTQTSPVKSADEISKQSSNKEQENDKTERKNCNKDSYEEDKCVVFLQTKLMKGSSIQTDIDELLNGLPLCLHTNGSVVHIDRQTQLCCNGVVNRTTFQECCKGELFDSRDFICCNNTLHRKTDTLGCCGIILYDTDKGLCCNGSLPVIPRLQNMECCGNKTFSTKTQVCCLDNVQQAHGLRNRKGDCCNVTSYHEDCHTCENNTILHALFDETAEICCHGKFVQRIHGNNSECCHRRIMNNATDACVENKIVPKQPFGNVLENSSFVNQLSLNAGEENKVDDGQKSTRPSITNINIEYIKPVIGGVIGCVFLTVGVIGCVCKKRTVFAKIEQLLRKNKCEACKEEVLVQNNENAFIQTENASAALNFAKDGDEKDVGEFQNLLEGNDFQQNMSVKECYTNEIANSENENVYSDMPRISHRNVTLPTMLSDIKKENIVDETNLITTHFKEGHTQTEQEHVTNRRTIFGNPFEHTFLLDKNNPKLAIPGSDVSLWLPKSLMKSAKVEINCTSFSSLSDLRKKLGLSEDEMLASPVVEFALTGFNVLPEHARVIVPFVGNPSDLIVKKFKSDDGLSTVVPSIELAEKQKQNEDLEIFYVIEGSFVIVYTKSFSGFYCTRCRHKRDTDLSIRSYIFGSYKRINQKYEVGISVYIADEIFKFKDYSKRMLDNEGRQEKNQLKDIPLNMPEYELNDTDFIEACITPENSGGEWIHRLHPRTKMPIQEGQKKICLGSIAQKCKKCHNFNPHELEIPYCTEWYLTTENSNIIPSEVFQCTIDLNICKRETGRKTETPIFIEDLRLRSKDRLSVKDNYQRAMTPAPPVQESCSGYSSVIPLVNTERADMTNMDTRLVRRELSRLPVTSYSTSNHARPPDPELSEQEINQLQALSPVLQDMNRQSTEENHVSAI